MKRLMQRIKKAIRSRKGETLMESIASLFILSILMVAVTTMIQAALNMTGDSIKNAERVQKAVNTVILSEYINEMPTEITFTGPGISAKHEIILNAAGGGVDPAGEDAAAIAAIAGSIVAFTPRA